MTVIAPVALGPGPYLQLRNAPAQADTGQTDWVAVPAWAKYAQIVWNATAFAGTTPTTTSFLKGVDPVDLTTAYTFATFTSSPDGTGAAIAVINVGPGVTGIADDVALAATGASFASINFPLPPFIGITLTFDRTTGNETYTYTLSIRFT